MVKDFASLLGELINKIASLYIDLDRKSYESLVGLLLLEDDIAVRDAVDEIIKEGRQVGIPPIYLASKKHHNFIVRDYCIKTIKNLDDYERIDKLTRGKNISDAMSTLIMEYGNFKHDY